MNLSALETIRVFHGLTCFELLWYEGHSLAQTIHTCLYLHRDAFCELWERVHVPMDLGTNEAERFTGRTLVIPESPRQTLDLVLCVYAAYLLKTCEFSRNGVIQADIYEVPAAV